jgi:hypothetical protein
MSDDQQYPPLIPSTSTPYPPPLPYEWTQGVSTWGELTRATARVSHPVSSTQNQLLPNPLWPCKSPFFTSYDINVPSNNEQIYDGSTPLQVQNQYPEW